MEDKSSNQVDLLTPEERAKAESYFNEDDRTYDLLLTPAVRRAAYSDRMAWVLSCMAHLAYDPFEVDAKSKATLEARLHGGGFRLIDTFTSPPESQYDTQAFLAVRHDKSYAVLAFRGTEVKKKEDVLADIRAGKFSTLEGRVHDGFFAAYEDVRKNIEASLPKINGLPLYITGHSLGAALATVATQKLEQNHIIRDQIAACYTFGSPRVGDEKFDFHLKSVIYRVVNTTDIVTVIPLLIMGYEHIGDIRFLSGPDQIRRGIPFFRRIFFFLIAVFRLFGPWVGDHGIEKYRNKLRAVARNRNNDLFVDGRSGGRF